MSFLSTFIQYCFRASSRNTLLILLAAPVLLSLASRAAADPQYVHRNNNEYYLPFLIDDGFAYLNGAENRFWQAEFTRRYLAVQYGEARVNRQFYVDGMLEGSYPIRIPSEPLVIGDILQENLVTNPDVVARIEAYYYRDIRKNWELSIDVATRIHIYKDYIPAEFYGRLVASHKGFAGLYPLRAGFYFGPQLKALDDTVEALTIGGFVLLSQTRATLTRATASITWWGDLDPFQNLLSLRLGQAGSVLKRRVNLSISAGIDMRQVRQERYIDAFNLEPPQDRYVDVVTEASAMALLPYKFRFGVSGRFLPVHEPDPTIIRWYRSVAPELSACLERKLSIVDLVLAYTLAWIPPYVATDTEYDDPGQGVIPNSTPGHLFSLGINLKI